MSIASSQCVHGLFEAQVERTPDAAAIIFEEQRVTYRELNARANQVAGCLRGLGVGPEVCVGILMDRSPDMIVGLLGILKAGGAYVPLDPSYPVDRLSFMMADASVPVLLTQSRYAHRFGSGGARVVRMDADKAVIGRESVVNVSLEVKSYNLAYLIYTSGSTGQPKGIEIPHSAVVNLLHSMQKQPGIGEKDVLLAVTTLSFAVRS